MELSNRHSDIEKKICDILHYIELCETNEEESIELVELLRICRENRREIKDELSLIEYFKTNLGTKMNINNAKQTLKAILGLDNRKYTPRKFDELFENCTMKGKRLVRSDLETKHEIINNKSNYCTEPAKEEGGEEIMEKKKVFTPFDDKENDWLSFAKQQAIFYRHAGNYINNLQLDIEEIDNEIEENNLQELVG